MTARATQQGLKAAVIQRGRVLDVDTAQYRLVVATEFTKKVVSGVSWSSPYQHFVQGEGIYVMPEVGSLVWLCDPSDGGMPIVLGWASAQDGGNYRARKMELNPGDTYLGTRDGNFLYLRRGGVVQIGGGPLSQRIFFPVNNTIKDICENYSLLTLGGELEWTVDRTETHTDGKRPARFRLKARQFANDKNPVALLEMGSHDGDDDTILSLLVKESADDGAATQISLSMMKSGDVLWKVKRDVSWEIEGSFVVKTTEDIDMRAAGDASFTADGAYSARGATAQVEAATGPATLKSPVQNLLDAPITLAGAGATQPVALAPALLAWLATHTHLIILPIPSTPTSPPVPPPPPSIASTSLLAK